MAKMITGQRAVIWGLIDDEIQRERHRPHPGLDENPVRSTALVVEEGLEALLAALQSALAIERTPNVSLTGRTAEEVKGIRDAWVKKNHDALVRELIHVAAISIRTLETTGRDE